MMWNDDERSLIDPGIDDEEVYEDDPSDVADEFDDLDDDSDDEEDETDDEVDHFYDGDGKLIHDTFDDEE